MRATDNNHRAFCSQLSKTRGAVVDNNAGVILFAFYHGTDAAEGLQRAAALARINHKDFLVLCVLPSQAGRANPMFPQNNFFDAMWSLHRAVNAAQHTQIMIDRIAFSPFPVSHMQVIQGDFVASVTAYAHEIKASLVVVPGRPEAQASEVTRLVLASNLPVLVARPAAAESSVVAATDLRDEMAPVLRQAVALCEPLDAELIAVHCVAEPSGVTAARRKFPGTLLRRTDIEAIQHRRLRRISSRLLDRMQTEVSVDCNPARAILDSARAHHSDIVVVGVRERTWFDRLIRSSVTHQVLSQAQRSVLVTPVSAA